MLLPPQPGDASADEVDAFVVTNNLDAHAAQIFRGERPLIQRMVLDRGSLLECKNPSSAVMGRIRDAKVEARQGRPPGGSMGGIISAMANGLEMSDVDVIQVFVTENQLDDIASAALREVPVHIQAEVISRGAVFGRSNPSGDVMGRIRTAWKKFDPAQNRTKEEKALIQSMTVNGIPPAGKLTGVTGLVGGLLGQSATDGQPPGIVAGVGVAQQAAGPANPALEAFIQENRLDDLASKALRDAPAPVQEEVLRDTRTLFGRANPSQDVMGRIRSARQFVAAGSPDGLGGGGLGLGGAGVSGAGLSGAGCAGAGLGGASRFSDESAGSGCGGGSLHGGGLGGLGLGVGGAGITGAGLSGAGRGDVGLGLGGIGLGGAGLGALGLAGCGGGAGIGNAGLGCGGFSASNLAGMMGGQLPLGGCAALGGGFGNGGRLDVANQLAAFGGMMPSQLSWLGGARAAPY